MSEIKIKYESLDKVIPAKYNPRVISEDMLHHLYCSLIEYGCPDPIIVNKQTKHIVGGHQRHYALSKLVDVSKYTLNGKEIIVKEELSKHGIYNKIPTVYIDVPESKEKQFNVILNKVGGDWDYNKLYSVLHDIDNAGLDIEMTGWEWESLELLSGLEREFSESVSDMDKIILEDINQGKDNKALLSDDMNEHISGAIKLGDLKENILFPSKNSLGIPELLESKLLDMPSKDFTNYLFKDSGIPESGWIHCICNHLHNSMKDNKRTLVSFSTWDEYFEAVWKYPSRQTIRLMNMKLGAITTPDFSLWWTDPKALQIMAVYKHRWVGRYWQEAGLSVVPYVNIPSYNNRDFSLLGFHKNMPCIFIQAQNTKTERDYTEWLDGLKYMLKTLSPASVILYAGDSGTDSIYKIINRYVDSIAVIKSRVSDIRSNIKKRSKKIL